MYSTSLTSEVLSMYCWFCRNKLDADMVVCLVLTAGH